MRTPDQQKRSEQADQLLNELDIRKGLRGNLFYLYPATFKTLHSILEAAEDFDGLIQLHAAQAMHSGKNEGRQIIYYNEELSYNAQLILQEVIDDYWACCLCFQNGFTKQAQAIMRSTIELLTQLYYLKHLDESGSLSSDSWAMGIRGIEKLTDKISVIRKMPGLKKGNLAARLTVLYDQLCTSTHSRKDRLVAENLPRAGGTKDMPSFEPLEILYTRGLFCAVLDLELRMIQQHFDEEHETIWLEQLRGVIRNMLTALNRFRVCITSAEKGYIIHREHIALSTGKQLLYSITLGKKLELPGRKSLTLKHSEVEEFQDKLQSRFAKDIG
jgi:hypothetical protein